VDLRCIRGAKVPAKERGRRSGSATEFDLGFRPWLSTLAFDLGFRPWLSTLALDLGFRWWISTAELDLGIQRGSVPRWRSPDAAQ
jgi:hypothetical protein